MRRSYIRQREEWPEFRWDWEALHKPLATVRQRQGTLLARMQSIGFTLRENATLEALTQEVQKSSEIEEEQLDRELVRSSVARHLGMEVGALASSDRRVDGVVTMMLDATQNYNDPLTVERLGNQHSALFPSGRSGLQRIVVGAWRDDSLGPMQVVSGSRGRERVHYEAPDATRLPEEMAGFLRWFDTNNELDLVLKAALVHFWFVTIHPFEDGNGRIARAIADMILARSEETKQRFYSMSAQIRIERQAYYDILEQTQKSDMDITPRMLWFLNCLDRALMGAESALETVLRQGRFWQRLTGISINERQRLLLNKLLDGFEGKLTTSK